MGKLRIARIKSATLIETLVAMTVLLTVVALTMNLFVQVRSTGTSYSKVVATALLEEYALTTDTSHAFFDETFSKEGFILSRKIEEAEIPGTVNIHFTVIDSLRQLKAEQHRIIIGLKSKE